MARIMVLDDDMDFLAAMSELIEMLGHKVSTVNSVEAAQQMLKFTQFDHVLLDLMLPDGSGLQVLDSITQSQHKKTQITIITGHPTIKHSIRELYGPTVNYLIKPIEFNTLKQLLSGQLSRPTESVSSQPAASKNRSPEQILYGQSKQIKQLISTIKRVASTNANVMLIGESGVGKELVTEAIHEASRASKPLIATNCGAMNRELINSELFGHEKGAFTGAVSRKAGVFEQAAEGTLFLDEITEMPLDLQVNLLRVLESNRFVRVGGNEDLEVRCRVVSATNRSEADIAKNKQMREDLYFRLAVFPIQIPPLRERQGDVPILANHFLDELNEQHQTNVKLNPAQLTRLEQYNWPGNVRELRHCIHRAFIMTDPDAKELELPDKLGSPFGQQEETFESTHLRAGLSIEEVERTLINMTLEKLNGDKTRAAKMLGVSTKTLYNRLKAYESEQPEEHDD